DDFISTSLLDDRFGPLGSVRGEDERAELFDEWLKLHIDLSNNSTNSDTIIEYDEKINKMRTSYFEKFQQSKNDSFEQAFYFGVYCILGAYKSVIVKYKS